MPRENKPRALFDDLWEIVKRDGRWWRCRSLSDLRYNRQLLWHSLKLLQNRSYTTREWTELIRYLLWRP